MAKVAVHVSVRSRAALLAALVALVAALTGPARAADPSARSERIGVVLVNFRNNAVQPFSPADARAWTFTDDRSVSAYYREVSEDRVALGGDVYGWLTLDRDDGPECDYAGWQDAADAQARRAGVPLDQYDVVVYASPMINACGFRGGSAIGGNRSFVNGPTGRGQWAPLVAHELGHAFGAEHANSLTCTDGTGLTVALSSTCQVQPYGDPLDLMGSGYRHHPNANHKAAMGILPGSAIATVSASGEYLIRPPGGDGLQLLRVPYDRDEDGAVRYLLLEYRQPSAFDEFSADDAAVRGVSVRLGEDAGQHAPTLLIDTTPETAGNFADAPLLPGRKLADVRRQLAVSVLQAGADGARVQVDYAGFVADWAACDGVTVPARVGRGRSVPVEVRFRNTGTTTWQGGDGYHVQTENADGDATLASGAVVSPGSVGAFTGSFTVPQQLGPRTIRWRPKLGGQVFGETCSAQVDVVADPDPPSAPAGLQASMQSQSVVQLSWLPATDNVGVKGYRVARSTDGTTYRTVADVTGTSATDAGLTALSTYWYRVEAYDAGGNVSTPSAPVVVQVPDMTPPSAPSGLTVAGRGPGTIDLAWSAATDNVGVDRYRVFRRGSNLFAAFTLVGETKTTAFRDTGLTGQSYSYYVVAMDKAGNTSARSNVVSARPQTCTVVGCV